MKLLKSAYWVCAIFVVDTSHSHNFFAISLTYSIARVLVHHLTFAVLIFQTSPILESLYEDIICISSIIVLIMFESKEIFWSKNLEKYTLLALNLSAYHQSIVACSNLTISNGSIFIALSLGVLILLFFTSIVGISSIPFLNVFSNKFFLILSIFFCKFKSGKFNSIDLNHFKASLQNFNVGPTVVFPSQNQNFSTLFLASSDVFGIEIISPRVSPLTAASSRDLNSVSFDLRSKASVSGFVLFWSASVIRSSFVLFNSSNFSWRPALVFLIHTSRTISFIDSRFL